MLYRLILPGWAKDMNPSLPQVKEGEFTAEELLEYNKQGFGVYYLPNSPSTMPEGRPVSGIDIDQFDFVFVDCDLKDGIYKSKEEFLSAVLGAGIDPTAIVDSGNGIHVYWQMTDLDAMSYLRFQRRLCRLYKTDEAVSTIYQLMRLPGYINTKRKDNQVPCALLETTEKTYTCEEMDKLLPPITLEDEKYCQNHYEKTYTPEKVTAAIRDELPRKFGDLLYNSKEARDIWNGNIDDRSKGDYRLGHLMWGAKFTKGEALSVLVNSAKALSRAPLHRVSYAQNIVDKIWTFELTPNKDLTLSETVKDILAKGEKAIKGERLPCWPYFDNTAHGFRLGQVIGLVAGSGVGKTALSLDMFKGFVSMNPDYEHFFVPLEQPGNEIADRWRTICGDDTRLHEKVHVLSNYNEDGTFRHLSLDDIKDYLVKFQQLTGKKIGCVVIDHIGALKKTTKDGENQGIMDICHSMKAFAIQTNTLLVMQSQSSREKAGIGDLELNKDAAYGTVFFESYCDYLITLWQPLKRTYADDGCPAVTAYKFCKIRHKKKGVDALHEDVCYLLHFDPKTEHFRELTELEAKSFDFFNKKATNLRKLDRRTDLVQYNSKGVTDGKPSSDPKAARTGKPTPSP